MMIFLQTAHGADDLAQTISSRVLYSHINHSMFRKCTMLSKHPHYYHVIMGNLKWSHYCREIQEKVWATAQHKLCGNDKVSLAEKNDLHMDHTELVSASQDFVLTSHFMLFL